MRNLKLAHIIFVIVALETKMIFLYNSFEKNVISICYYFLDDFLISYSRSLLSQDL